MDVNEILRNIGGSSLNVNDIISGGITLFLGVIAVGAFASLIYSGFLYITAGGDTAKAEKARKNITWAIIGIILAVSSYLLIQLVVSVFNADNPASQQSSGEPEQQREASDTNDQNNTPPANGNPGPIDDIVE